MKRLLAGLTGAILIVLAVLGGVALGQSLSVSQGEAEEALEVLRRFVEERPDPTTTTVPPTTTTAPPTTTTAPPTTTTVPPTTTTVPPDEGYASDYYAQWSNSGQLADPGYFPLGVWMQYAGRMRDGVPAGTAYQELGITIDDGLWGWMSSENQDQMPSVVRTDWHAFPSPGGECSTTEPGITRVNGNPAEAEATWGWLLSDEPDMNRVNDGNECLQPLPMRDRAREIGAADPTRPVHINFGKGMAIRNWIGYQRPQTGSYESDMRTYCEAVDIPSADYYGWTDPWEPESYHGAWTYGEVIDNLAEFCPGKPTWAFVEASQPWNNSGDRITPAELESAVWQIIVHGGDGILYFSHDFFPTFEHEDGMLADPAIRARVGEVNGRILSYAPVLNRPDAEVDAVSSGPVGVDALAKRDGGATYVFAQGDGSRSFVNGAATTGTITVPGGYTGPVEVLDEGRTVQATNGVFTDDFGPYEFHVYRLGV